MTQPQVTHALLTAAVIALIAWRLYARVRRNIGRQRYSRVRPWITLTVLPLVLVLLAPGTHGQAGGVAALAGGIMLGIGLGVLGLRLTRFEASAQGMYYVPSAHLGIALSTLFVCRLAYRFVAHGLPVDATAAGPPAATPLTLLLFGTLAGYYCTYAVGLLRWAARARGAAVVSAP